jgi:hypothetical protein
VEWHPDATGAGLWYDSDLSKIVSLVKDKNAEGLYDFNRFSLDPGSSRMSVLSFSLFGQDSYSCKDESNLVLVIKGPELTFSGVYTDGSVFTERYRAVDAAFLRKKLAEAESASKAVSGKKNPSLQAERKAWGSEMIAQALRGIELPR